MIDLQNKREMFWDSYLVDEEKSTALKRLNQPVFKKCCFSFDKGLELDSISNLCMVKDDKGYKMYYSPWNSKTGEIGLAVIESEDGINWTRPDLNICDCPELSGCNNLIIKKCVMGYFVFYDTNPACPKDEKYKAIGTVHPAPPQKAGLWCLTSPDGYHFRQSHLLTEYGRFDSLNTAHWDGSRYACYFRDFHNTTIPDNIDGTEAPEKLGGLTTEQWHSGIRDVRVMFSDDFKNWTKPERIEFYDGLDYALYTNGVTVYDRAPHILVGFPTRYFEKKEWTENEEQIASSKLKKESMQRLEKRAGLAINDCIFMHSRDGKNWSRFNEAFICSGYENEQNWVYGDCYPAYGLIDSGKENYYILQHSCHRSFGMAKPLNLYEIRKDGFACYMADDKERVIVTNPLTFTGKDLHINFSSSAFGYIYVDVLDENGEPHADKKSFEIYGDTIDRRICFEDGSDFSEFAGRPVRIRFRLRDAKLYSMWFK